MDLKVQEVYTTTKAKKFLRTKGSIVVADIGSDGTWVTLQKDDFIHSVLNQGHYFVNYDGEQQPMTWEWKEGFYPILYLRTPCCVSNEPREMAGEDEIFEDS